MKRLRNLDWEAIAGITAAVAAGISGHIWTIEEIVSLIDQPTMEGDRIGS